MMARTGLILLAIAAVAGGAWWLSGVRAPRSEHGGAGRDETSLAGAEGPVPAAGSEPGPHRTLPTTVRVQDPDGRPVSGARVEVHVTPDWEPWLTLVDRLDDPPAPSAALETDGVGRATVGVTTDPRLVTMLAVRRQGFGLHHDRLDPAVPEHRVTLRPACALAGRVLEADGRVVSGARVYAAYAWRLNLAPSAVSGDDGRYRLDGLAPRRITVVVARPGSSPMRIATVDLARVSLFDVVLAPACTLRGRVLAEPDGHPLAGVAVIACRSKGYGSVALGHAVTDDRGRYEIRGLPPGFATVDVEAPGYWQRQTECSAASLQERVPLELDVRLEPTTTLRGIVRDPDGRPVEGVIVSWSGPGARTDAHGRFTLEVGAGTWTLRPGPKSVVVSPGETVDVVLVTEPWCRVEGRVLEGDGSSAAGVQVFLRAEPRGGRAVTDADGRFVTRLASRDGTAQPHILRPGDLHSTEGPELKLIGDPARVEIAMPPPRRHVRVHGNVTAPAGVRLRECHVRALPTDTSLDDAELPFEFDEHPSWGTEVRVGPGGSYELTLPLDESGIAVYAHGRGTGPCRPVTLTLAPGQDDVRVDLRLDSGLALRGKVVDPSGSPVIGAAVTLERPRRDTGHRPEPSVLAVSGSDGTFEILHLPGGEYWVAVTAAGRVGVRYHEVEMPMPEPLVAVLPSARTIRGHVRFSDGSTPGQVEIWIHVEDPELGDWIEPSDVESAPDGTFVIGGLPPGPCELRVTPGPSRVEFRELEVTIEAGRDDVDLVVTRGETISGRVLRPDGSACGGARIEAFDEEGDEVGGWCMSDEDGSFVLSGLPSGAFRLRANAEGVLPAVLEGVKAGATALELRVGAGLVVAGVVVDEHGKPRAGLEINDRVKTDEEGRFRLEGLPEGKVRLRLTNSHGRLAFARRGVVEAGREDLRIVVVRERMLRGRAVDGSGRPVRGAEVDAESLDGDHSHGTETALDGTFELRVIPTRRYRIVVDARIGAVRLEDVPGDGPELLVRVPRWPSVSGVALDASGEPLRGAEVRLDREGFSRDLSTRTDEAGRFVLEGVPPGRHRVHAVRRTHDDTEFFWYGEIEAGASGVILRPEK